MEKTNRKSRRTGKWAIIIAIGFAFLASPIFMGVGVCTDYRTWDQGVKPYGGYQTVISVQDDAVNFNMQDHSSVTLSISPTNDGESVAFQIEASGKPLTKYSHLMSPDNVTNEYTFNSAQHYSVPDCKRDTCPTIKVWLRSGGKPITVKVISVVAK